jgi:hypothetical protein
MKEGERGKMCEKQEGGRRNERIGERGKRDARSQSEGDAGGRRREGRYHLRLFGPSSEHKVWEIFPHPAMPPPYRAQPSESEIPQKKKNLGRYTGQKKKTERHPRVGEEKGSSEGEQQKEHVPSQGPVNGFKSSGIPCMDLAP